jgi:glycosyltransferase involved in cell wall biosynthesis
MAAKDLITVIILYGHGNEQWLKEATDSVKEQTYGFENIELMVVDNADHKKKIGEAWNEAVAKAKGKYCFFLGDDDFIQPDYLTCLHSTLINTKAENKDICCVTSYVMRFMGVGNNIKMKSSNTFPTGMMETEFLKEHKFDEERVNRIDTLWYNENKNNAVCAYWNYGYFYRGHENQISKCGIANEKFDNVFITKYPHFIRNFIGTMENSLLIDKYDHLMVYNAKMTFCDFGSEDAIHLSNAKTDGKKILRIHRFSAYTNLYSTLDLDKFDHVIFTSHHIKRYVETKISKTIKNATVIKLGTDIDRFNYTEKVKNNKVGICGYINQKKGFVMLKLLAKTFPSMEFHVLGQFQDEALKQYLTEKSLPNIFIKTWADNPEVWYQDKTYILSLSYAESQQMSIIEGMACGCKPAVLEHWIGANDVYLPEHLWGTVEELNKIFIGDFKPEEYREYVVKNYNQKDEFAKIKELIGG